MFIQGCTFIPDSRVGRMWRESQYILSFKEKGFWIKDEKWPELNLIYTSFFSLLALFLVSQNYLIIGLLVLSSKKRNLEKVASLFSQKIDFYYSFSCNILNNEKRGFLVIVNLYIYIWIIIESYDIPMGVNGGGDGGWALQLAPPPHILWSHWRPPDLH